MAIPKPDPRDWQIANAQELQVTDKQVLAMLRSAKRNVDRILAELPAGKQEVKRAQLESTRARLLAQQADIFDRLGDIVSARRARAASRSAGLSAAADRALLDLVGKGAEGQFLYESALQVGQRQIDAALARMKHSQLPLSKRIYDSSVWMGGRLGKLINETLASGLNAKEFARRARDWFNPNTPGGVRYAAMRLARTEINNAFHAMTAEKAARDPWITEVEWNLSKSHPKPDICNKVHDDSPFPADKVPARPHPQCMCYITPKSISEDEFIDNFLKGDYNEFLDNELAAAGWEPEQPAPATASKSAGTHLQRPEQRIPVGESALTPKNVLAMKRKGPIQIQDRDGNWIKVDSITLAPGGGSRTGGARGGQYAFRDIDGNVIRRSAANELVPTRSAVPSLGTKVSNDGYSPGQWQRQTDNKAAIADLKKNLRAFNKDMSDEQLTAMAEKFLAGTTDDTDVEFRNGPHQVIFAGKLSPEQQQQFLVHVDHMQSKFPANREMAIRVAPSSEFGWDVGGETTISTGHMRINERVLTQDFWPGMPVSKDVPSALYVLAHEWGHAFPDKNDARNTHAHQDAVSAGGMTRYGTIGGDGAEGNAAEGYAEAFAEWSLTDGKTTNKAAQEYARRFHWGERFGS